MERVSKWSRVLTGLLILLGAIIIADATGDVETERTFAIWCGLVLAQTKATITTRRGW